MSHFSHVAAVIPESLLIPARMIGRALDGDIGGAETFGANTFIDPNGIRFHYTSIYGVDPMYAKGMRYLLNDPKALLDTIILDTDLRFPEAPIPTLEQCITFCANCRVSIDGDTSILNNLQKEVVHAY